MGQWMVYCLGYSSVMFVFYVSVCILCLCLYFMSLFVIFLVFLNCFVVLIDCVVMKFVSIV